MAAEFVAPTPSPQLGELISRPWTATAPKTQTAAQTRLPPQSLFELLNRTNEADRSAIEQATDICLCEWLFTDFDLALLVRADLSKYEATHPKGVDLVCKVGHLCLADFDKAKEEKKKKKAEERGIDEKPSAQKTPQDRVNVKNNS